MTIFEFTPDKFLEFEETTFSRAGLRERQDLQRLLRSQIEIISPDLLLIAEEFSQWEDSNRRIDLLGIDKDANLVVIELKRTEKGGHMELQAIRYASMISAMTFERAVEVYSEFLSSIDADEDAHSSLLDFLEWDEPDEDQFAQDVRIVLVSAEFSKELTTSVIWLNDRGLDIECVRIKPYGDKDRILVDVQQIIPLPEAEDYQVRLKEKQQRERASRQSGRDYTKYDVSVGRQTFERLSKRAAIHAIIRHLMECGVAPEKITTKLSLPPNPLFQVADGELGSESFIEYQLRSAAEENRSFDHRRFSCGEDELMHFGGKTFALSNQWGGRRFKRSMEELEEAFPDAGFSCTPAE